MRRTGTILRFDPDRGFGFLRSAQSPADVFFHVRDLDPRDRPPVVGMAVEFDEIHVGGKGPRAMALRRLAGAGATAAVQPVPPRQAGNAPARRPTDTRVPRPQPARGPSASLPLFWLALALECGLLAWCIVQGRLAPVVLAGVLALNLLTFWFYWHDKHAAQRGAWRVSEQQLHLLALAGGWPGAWWAQQLLRHKSRKPSFRQLFAATVVLHLAALAGLAVGPTLR